MGHIYTDEDFPGPAARRWRKLGHNVLTVREAGHFDRCATAVSAVARFLTPMIFQPSAARRIKEPVSSPNLKPLLTEQWHTLSVPPRPISSGKSSGIVAITLPNQYPQGVWDQRVAQGKLKYTGQGMY